MSKILLRHTLIKFVSDLGQVSGFLRVHRFPPPKKTDHHEILLSVALNTITPPYPFLLHLCVHILN